MFKKILVPCMIAASFSLASSAFADTTVTWHDSVGYDQQKFETWYNEPGNAKLWSGWYSQYHTDPEFVTFCKQTWAGTYCK